MRNPIQTIQIGWISQSRYANFCNMDIFFQIFVVFSEYLNTGDTKTFLTYYLTNLEKSYIHIYTIQIGWISQSRYANFCNRLVSYQKRKPLNNMNGKFMICHDLFISCMLQQFLLLYNCTMGSIPTLNRILFLIFIPYHKIN